MSKITYINLGNLGLPEFQAHGNIPPADIKEISESIKSIGVIEPLIVRKTKQGFEIVAGCVRYHASKLAGLKAVPCIVMTLDSKSAEVLKLHENVKRIPLDHVDQGHTFINMMKTFEMTEKDISECSGKSISYISQHISLVRLDNELTKAVKEGSISFSQARELMRVDDISERNRLFKYCQKDGATIQVLQQWVQDHLRSISNFTPAESSAPDDSPPTQTPYMSRDCMACGKSVNIDKIRQVFFCPVCCDSILGAINEERSKIIAETHKKYS